MGESIAFDDYYLASRRNPFSDYFEGRMHNNEIYT